ncbi:YadA C-terminal domain-containing protein [Acinetobacter modestus]|uniref:YadA C-terminal domain-containing protein n=1 Tax=Acinetobacter modestus TaxID=1776740 RepID=UPI00301A6E28
MKKSFQLSALAVALVAVSNVHAVTINGNVNGFNIPTGQDVSINQFVDLGSSNSGFQNIGVPSPLQTGVVTRYDLSATQTVYAVQENSTSSPVYYEKNSVGEFVKIADQTTAASNVAGKSANAAGLLETTSSKQQKSETIKTVSDKNVQYGEKTTEREAVTVSKGQMTDGVTPVEDLKNSTIPTSTETVTKDQSVTTGIIGSSNGTNTYGTVAKSKDTSTSGAVIADKTTTLTADGIVAKDTVSGKSTTVSSDGITTGAIVVDGTDVKATLDQHTTDIAALNGRVDQEVLDRTAADTALNTRVDNETAARTAADTQLQANIDTEAATRAAADTALNTRVDNETAARTAADTQLQANIDTEAATRAAADTALNTRVDNETAARTAADTQIRTDFAAADAATLTSAKGYTDTTATTLRSEAAAETVRVNKAIIDGDAATLSSAKGYTDTKSAATLASANAYTDGRANQLNTRIDDVQRTAYRGIAISLAAQQAVPSIGPGQVAIFGGVGHYEGETAGSIGVVTAFTDRLSASGAFGFAGGNEFGGRVGVAYVFGGK